MQISALEFVYIHTFVFYIPEDDHMVGIKR